MVGHNVIGPSLFDYDWGSINQAEPWYQDQPYGDTPGSAVDSDLTMANDAANVVARGLWRIPTADEFDELFSNCDYLDTNGQIIDDSVVDKRATVNGVVGLRLRSRINSQELFLPACGYGQRHELTLRNSRGFYWTSSWVSSRFALRVLFTNTGVNTRSNGERYVGASIRPVMSPLT